MLVVISIFIGVLLPVNSINTPLLPSQLPKESKEQREWYEKKINPEETNGYVSQKQQRTSITRLQKFKICNISFKWIDVLIILCSSNYMVSN